jgi:hypothetical protein
VLVTEISNKFGFVHKLDFYCPNYAIATYGDLSAGLYQSAEPVRDAVLSQGPRPENHLFFVRSYYHIQQVIICELDRNLLQIPRVTLWSCFLGIN